MEKTTSGRRRTEQKSFNIFKNIRQITGTDGKRNNNNLLVNEHNKALVDINNPLTQCNMLIGQPITVKCNRTEQ